MPVQLPLIPIIPIDSDETQNVEISQNAGHDFTLDEVQDWLERQAVHQVHKPCP
ncbi:hypothetical protein RhiirA4_454609 [Rhizophagus irregularis]|uniref:Uncharacterized protein n=1 Tax=Rhizophagus irregularis TaxID=588596 RepID=A0A2I1G3E4_9GLOM|nr:hypothetical protein RhiirA4_454609 [Rhizophagus irregularis]